MSQTKKNFSFLLYVISPIMAGFVIYSFWRGINIIDPMHRVFPLFVQHQPPGWVLYNLPDGLWLYSYTRFMKLMWSDGINIHSLLWIFSGLFIAILAEMLQYFKLLPGSFDLLDIVFYLCAFLFANAGFIYQKINKNLSIYFNLMFNQNRLKL